MVLVYQNPGSQEKTKQNKKSDHVDELKSSLNRKACLIQFSSIF